MTKRLDDLFDPDRLRESWGRAPVEEAPAAERAAEGGAAEGAAPPHAAHGMLREIEETIGRRFGAQAAPFGPLLERANDLLARRFPAGERGETPPDEKELGAVRKELGETLERIEDLIEAIKVASGR